MVQQQDVLAVCCYLKDFNISISPDNDWLQQCIDYFKTANPQSSRTELQEFVCQQWLLADLRIIHNGCFPLDCGEDVKCVLLNGKYSVQVNWVRDVGKSSYSQLRNITGDLSRNNEIDIEEQPEEKSFTPIVTRMLLLEVTDGITTLQGMEYHPIKKFTVPILPGTKMIITGPVECRRGILLLQEENVTILGGEVDSLLDINSTVNVLARSLNLPKMSDENTPASSVTAPAADSRPTSPVNDQRNVIPLHSRQTAMAPPANRNRDTTAIFPSAPTAVFDEESATVSFDDGFDEDDELLLQVPEEVLNATSDEGQSLITQASSSQNGVMAGQQMDENDEVVYSDESDKEIFLDNPMISQQVRRSLSSQITNTRSTARCETQQIQPTATQQPSVFPQNSINRQNVSAPKPLPPVVKQQIPVTNKLSSFSNIGNNTSPTNSDIYSIPGTSFQNSSLLFNNNSNSGLKKPSVFSKSQNKNAKIFTSYGSNTVERKNLSDDDILIRDASVTVIDDDDDDDILIKDASVTVIDDDDDDGSVNTSRITEEIFGSVQRLSSKLRIVQSEWVLTACVSDGSRTFDVKFSSQVVDEIIGFSAAELEARRFEAANNPAVKEKFNNMLQNGQKELSTLCCAMLLEHSKDGDMSTVIKIMK